MNHNVLVFQWTKNKQDLDELQNVKVNTQYMTVAKKHKL
jgi:hypothetical protein